MTMDDAQLARLLLLADKQELQELVAVYSQCLDHRDYERLRSLFTEDSINLHGDDTPLGVDEFVEGTRSNDAHAHTTHYVLQALFDVDGDTATGEAYKMSYQLTSPPESRETLWASRSQDEFRRVDGVWKFTRRAISLDWTHVRTYNPAMKPGFYLEPEVTRGED
ncbi:MAG: Ketosteroid isomerase-like enzyme [Nocardioidaceae bacterium]|nr:Ketosteroid isomerase-like enzyme [Nocardioidaceae bacterium]